MNEDAELLRRYAVDRSDPAFTALVQRHIGLVYATALRRLAGDRHLAEDVAQVVFSDLARKARTLQGRATIAGWLYVSTQHAAAAVVRKEQRRKAREIKSYTMSADESSAPLDAEWQKVRPVLDDAMTDLKEADREAIVLRFFQGRTCAEIAATLRVTDEAARKRIDRGLDKLRDALLKRGIVSTSTALGATLAAAPIEVPGSLGEAVAARALQSIGTSTAATFLTAGKALFPLAAALALGGWAVVHQRAVNAQLSARVAQLTAAERSAHQLQLENDALRKDLADTDALRRSVQRLPALRVAVVLNHASVPSTSTAVTVTPDGTIQWGNRFVTLDRFLRELKALHASAPDHDSAIVVRAQGARFSAFAYVIDEARKSGIQHVSVESDTPADPKLGFSWF